MLPITGAAHVAERHIRTVGPTSEAELLRWLERLDIEPARARQAVDLALARGRLVRLTDDDGETVLRRPRDWRSA
jgi:hypothetical protein